MSESKEFINAVIYSNNTSLSDNDFIRAIIDKDSFCDLKSVNGDFCGATKRDGKWILFRDHMGVMPLYYYLKDDTFYFAQDIRDLCAIDGVDLSINEKWFYLDMTGRSTLSLRETEFKYIFAVCPGTWTEFSMDNSSWVIKENTYWIPGGKKIRFNSDKEYIDELRSLIESAVKLRLDKYPGRVGAESSGGLDSSVIDLLIAKDRKDVVFASWSIPYDVRPMQKIDERQVVEDVCNACGVPFEFIPYEETEVCDCEARFLPAFSNTIQLSKTAKLMSDKGVSVVFTGHGGDEGVSHRCNISELWHHGEYSSYIKEIWNGTRNQKLRILRCLKRGAYGVFKKLPELKSGWQNELYDLSCCLNSGFLKSMSDTATPVLHFAFDPTKYVLSGGSRPRLDNCALQAGDFGVRYVFPFLDYRVIDFALSIPRRMYIHNGQNRYIYREAFKDIMPESLYNVNYKDFPSLRPDEDVKPKEEDTSEKREEISEEDRIKFQREWVDMQLGNLNWDYWGKYLDKSSCEKLLMSDFRTISEEDGIKLRLLTNKLYLCRLIQNLQDNGKNWKKDS